MKTVMDTQASINSIFLDQLSNYQLLGKILYHAVYTVPFEGEEPVHR
jgi:hypothetical protein